ncbi:hypothetical protein PP707_03725 [Acetobacter pasteurianus]|nr:hypothetical protein [Acetobacter pasteurianus]
MMHCKLCIVIISAPFRYSSSSGRGTTTITCYLNSVMMNSATGISQFSSDKLALPIII